MGPGHPRWTSIVGDREVALPEVPELTGEMKVASPLVCEEVILDASPGGVGVHGAAYDQLDEGVRQGEDDPEDKPMVDGHPGGIRVGGGRSLDMFLNAVLEKNEVEEGAPFNVVVFGWIKFELDMIGDVIGVDVVGLERGRSDGGEDSGDGGGGCGSNGGRKRGVGVPGGEVWEED
jgi:hypothetical protein